MTERSTAMESLRQKMGFQWAPVEIEIEKSLMRRIARAVQDPNPLWQNEVHAQSSRNGTLVASPALIIALGWEEFDEIATSMMPFGAGVHGSTHLRCYRPIRLGDTINVTTKLVEVSEKSGKQRKHMVFVTYERTYVNQNQELVAKCNQVLISYPIHEGEKLG